MGELNAFERGKGLEKVLRESTESPMVDFEGWIDSAIAVINRVITTPKNSAVGRGPVVVELVARVADSLSPIPPNGVPLRCTQRLGSKHIVVNRHHVLRHLS